jgi:hypothetical protein
MTDFIPAPAPNTNSSKQLHPDYFNVGQKIKVNLEASADGQTQPLDTVEVIAAPEATLTVDRTPYVLVTYAANGSDAASTPEIAYYLGMTGSNAADFQSYTKTPLTSASQADFDDDTQNGTLLYMKDKVITPMAYGTVDAAQTARQQKFKRFIFINPGGFINVDANTPLFPPAAGSLLEQTEYRVGTTADGASTATAFLSTDARNTTGQDGHVPTPFTTGGRAVGAAPTGDPGDRKKAWAAAIDHLHTEVTGSEAIAYIGYDVVYTDTNYDTYKTTDSAINQASANAVWQRARPERSFGPFRYNEWQKLQEAGFDVPGYDTGGRIYFDGTAPIYKEPGFTYTEEPGSRVWDSFVYHAGARTHVEAVARDLSTGAQLTGDDAGTYTTVRAWTIANQLVQINDEETNAVLTTSTNNQRANFWELDPATTETHIIFRWSDWTSKTVAEYQKAVWTAFHRGWICGISSAAVGQTANHKAFIDYIAQVNMLDPSVDNSGNALNPYTLGVEYYPLLDSNKLSQRVHNFVAPTGSWTLQSGSQWNSTAAWDAVGITEDATGLAVSGTTSPRLRHSSGSVGTIGEGFVSVDLSYTSEVQRDAVRTAHGDANIKFRVQWPDLGIDVETLTIAEAETVLGGFGSWEPTPSGNGFIRLPIRHSSFATAPTNNGTNGLGNNIGWDTDSKVIIDVIIG